MKLATFRTTLLAVVLVLAATVATAQQTAAPKPAEKTATATAADTATATQAYDSRNTRDELKQILERHPREVGVVLKLDPMLFQNDTYMAAYPELREFVRQHPEVAQNPGYFLESVWVPGDVAPEKASERMTRQVMEGISVVTVMLIVITALTWLIRTLLEHRRWSRTSRAQIEIHNKLLDRFTSHEDLLRYVQSAAGKEFIQSAVTPIASATPGFSAPVSRILWSVQIGVVLSIVGIGLQLVSGRVDPDASGSLFTLGILILSTGLGFALSAAAGYFISRKLGVWPAAPGATETETQRTLSEQ